MPTLEHELRQLRHKRDELASVLSAHQHSTRWMAGLAIPIVTVVVVLLAAATIFGQLSLEGLLLAVALGGLSTYILSREVRWQGLVISGFEVLALIFGVVAGPREDMDDVRRRLAECEARIRQLEGKSVNR